MIVQITVELSPRFGEENMRYKDYPKHDMRRCFALLLTIEKLAERATMHYLSLELGCTRAEVVRAVDLARKQLNMRIEKPKFAYEICSWGVLSREGVLATMHAAPQDNQSTLPSTKTEGLDWSRQFESDLVNRCLEAARRGSNAASREEADIYRLSAQLLKTRYPDEARKLDNAAVVYFGASGHKPRSFPQVVDEGLVRDVPRFRHLLENALAGVKSW